MIFCNCCERPIRGKVGYSCRLGLYEQLSPRVIVRTGWTKRALCPACMARIEHAKNQRITAQRPLIRPILRQNCRILA
jgi:hypothetical protein